MAALLAPPKVDSVTDSSDEDGKKQSSSKTAGRARGGSRGSGRGGGRSRPIAAKSAAPKPPEGAPKAKSKGKTVAPKPPADAPKAESVGQAVAPKPSQAEPKSQVKAKGKAATRKRPSADGLAPCDAADAASGLAGASDETNSADIEFAAETIMKRPSAVGLAPCDAADAASGLAGASDETNLADFELAADTPDSAPQPGSNSGQDQVQEIIAIPTWNCEVAGTDCQKNPDNAETEIEGEVQDEEEVSEGDEKDADEQAEQEDGDHCRRKPSGGKQKKPKITSDEPQDKPRFFLMRYTSRNEVSVMDRTRSDRTSTVHASWSNLANALNAVVLSWVHSVQQLMYDDLLIFLEAQSQNIISFSGGHGESTEVCS